MVEIALPEGQIQLWATYSFTIPNLTLPADTGDFVQIVGGVAEWRLVEVLLAQTALTDLTMEGITIVRGTGGSGGDPRTERKYGGISSGLPFCAVETLPTTDVGTIDLEHSFGWNMVQPALWSPGNEALFIPCQPNDDIGISTTTGTAHVGVAVSLIWQERRRAGG